MEQNALGPDNNERKGSSRLILVLAFFTLIVLGGAGAWLISAVQGRSLTIAVLGTLPWWWHAVIGLSSGWLIAFGGWWIIARPWMDPVRIRYADMIGPLMPGLALQVFVSICAGVGEELLFRGALQHWLGIPLTAIGFVALHGYLHPRDWRVSAYGAYMTVAMFGLGMLAKHAGLLAPMVAHTVIDIVLFGRLASDWRSRSGRS